MARQSKGKAIKTAAALLILISAAVALVGPAASNVTGVFDARDRGCYCHAPLASTAVGFTVTGLPGTYTPGANYTVVINVSFTDVAAAPSAPQGGFNLEVTAGRLSVPPGMEDFVQVVGNQATHTLNGSRMRAWAVNWSAPDQPGHVVTFSIAVNTANGNKSETFGTDHWTSKSVVVGLGQAPEIRGPTRLGPTPAFETLGMLSVAGVAGAVSIYTFLGARKTPPGQGGRRDKRRQGER